MKHKFDIREEAAQRFRTTCAQNGVKANRVFDREVIRWRLRGMPSYQHLVPNGETLSTGKRSITCREITARAVKIFAHENGVPYYQVVESIMYHYMASNE